jgi:hypothetical protein
MKAPHSSAALCNFGAVDIRRASERLAAWEVDRMAMGNMAMGNIMAMETCATFTLLSRSYEHDVE